MITITRTYDIKAEYKLIYQALRFMIKQECYKSLSSYLKIDLTYTIDCFRARWEYIGIPKNTISKLYRFAITYRYNATH